MSIEPLQLGSELVRRIEAKGKTVTNLSIQKLAYFCHGWHLAFLDAPLVEQRFEAWRLGPVLPKLYRTYRPFSCNPLSATHPIFTRQTSLPADSDSAELIDVVVDEYGDYSAAELIARTQEPGGPWEQVWLKHIEAGKISHASIKAHFQEKERRAVRLSAALQP
ncbi:MULTISPECIES: Panacea domain-containing protein [unclassified Achromobacter]|uniref:Panacea domain-containing protein n=1 Tax=unclassified Achromobacter TaxID=2626865 RepID=UPI000B518904|nr:MULTISPECIES: type II toxin-antitoxin system antitoxin SocA domain-containing protein [unclassified Achromobacter]OWT74675.1 hypothetical protein CEY05_19010 [Achromobacter sp. HZ34]OWT79142.1 hypothetical protein CEY04_08930 [Achromobacter sp. HZ28]